MLTSQPCFAVDHRRFGDRTVVSVTGELDIATAPQLAAVLALAMGGRPAELCVDLMATTFIDSTGLNVLSSAKGRYDGALAVICPPRVRRVFEIAGLAGLLTLRDGPQGVGPGRSRNREDSQVAG